MMKFGLLTAILDGWTFEEAVEIAADMGFKCLEVACWPAGKAERRYAGVSHIDCERVCEDDAYAKYVLDLVASKGTPIYASRSGYVTIATYESTAGNYVTINHQDGYTSVYMHMTHDVVSVGEYVKAGQLIGYVGNTGRSKGFHLHFGISYNGTYVNPMNYI